MSVTPRSPGDLLTATIFNTKLEAPIDGAEIAVDGVTGDNIAAGAIGPTELAPVPSCRAYGTAPQSIPNGAGTAIILDAERWDSAAMHAAGAGVTRVTITSAGLYRCIGAVMFATNAAGRRLAFIMVNGGAQVAMQSIPGLATGEAIVLVVGEWQCSVGDYFELYAYQDSGGALSTVVSAAVSPELSVTRLGRLT